MTSALTLGYVELAVSDVAQWRTFATEILGLELIDDRADGFALRMDENAYRFLVTQGDADDIVLAGWEVANQAALTALEQRLTALGVVVTHATEEQTAARRVRGLIRFNDPDGFASEAYYGPTILYDQPFRSPRRISGFHTEGQGLGHLTMTIADTETSLRFYREGLGFAISDTIDISFGPVSFLGTFLHCNARHHTLALAAVPAPKRLHHLMIQARALDDVGMTLDAVQDAGIEITASLGRHTNDHMFSFYMRSPSGFEIEYGWGAREISLGDWSMQHHTSMSIWGHRKP